MEDSNARETLREFPRAAGAYDRIPIANASAVWTLDTSTDIFLLHSIQVRKPPRSQCIDAQCSEHTANGGVVRRPVSQLCCMPEDLFALHVLWKTGDLALHI